MARKNWELKVSENKVVLKRQATDDFMFYLVYTPYDGEHENSVYWVSPIVYVSDTTAYIAKTRMLYRAFKSECLESAIKFAEDRINSLIENSNEDDGITLSFNGYENALAWKAYPADNKTRAISFSSKYKDEAIDIDFFLLVEDTKNPPIIVIKDGTSIDCGFKKLKVGSEEE